MFDIINLIFIFIELKVFEERVSQHRKRSRNSRKQYVSFEC